MEQHQRSLEGSLTSLCTKANQILVEPLEGAIVERNDSATIVDTIVPESVVLSGTATKSTTQMGTSSMQSNELKASATSNNHLNGEMGAGPLRATTIGTVVVRCGPIQLVIALLQVRALDLFTSVTYYCY